jgi:hypothetical protein
LAGALLLAFRRFFFASAVGFFVTAEVLPESSKNEAAGRKASAS